MSGINPFDLAPPAKPLLPHMAPLLSGAALERARAAAERARRERGQKAEAATAEARTRWQALRDRFESGGERLGVAVLDLHQPWIGLDGAVCSECLTSDCYEAVSAPWPCATYSAVDTDPSTERGS